MFQMFEVGPWSDVDTNGDGFVDTIETRNAARKVSGLTPLSEEVRTIDQSWTLNVADNVKDQYTDELTFNVEREIAKNLSISGTYIYKHSGNLFANVPINKVTGQEWEYERIPFETSSGQRVMLYSVLEKDYNGDGVIDSEDIAWIGDNTTSRVQNLGAYDGIKPQRNFQGLQFVLRKRYSDRWQALASFLYSNSTGIGRRSLRQDVNVEGPMFWDDNWMGSLNQTINNLQGPLPYTPKYRVQALRLVHGATSGHRSWWPAADALRARVVAARNVSSAHAVRRSAGRRHRYGGPRPNRRRRSETSGVSADADPVRPPRREVVQDARQPDRPVHRRWFQHLQHVHAD